MPSLDGRTMGCDVKRSDSFRSAETGDRVRDAYISNVLFSQGLYARACAAGEAFLYLFKTPCVMRVSTHRCCFAREERVLFLTSDGLYSPKSLAIVARFPTICKVWDFYIGILPRHYSRCLDGDSLKRNQCFVYGTRD